MTVNTTNIKINLQDKRDVRALKLLQGARSWAKCVVTIPEVGPRRAYGIPSESEPDVYRLVNLKQCSCPDFQNRQDGGTFRCAHIRACQWYVEIVKQERRKAEQRAAQAERDRLDAEARRDARYGLVDAF